MTELSDDSILKARFDAIADAHKRSQIALLLSSLGSGVILASEWNAYLSWDRQWPSTSAPPGHWGQQQVLEEKMRAWVDTNTVDISLVGLRLSVSDAAVLGAIVLLAFSYYLCTSLRRENHDVGSLLADMTVAPADTRNRVLQRILALDILSNAGESDTPYSSLDATTRNRKRILFVRATSNLLIYLPVFTIAVILLSDIYFAFLDISPERQNSTAAWFALSPEYRIQILLMDAFALFAGILTLNFCRYSAAYVKGTDSVVHEFSRLTDT